MWLGEFNAVTVISRNLFLYLHKPSKRYETKEKQGIYGENFMQLSIH